MSRILSGKRTLNPPLGLATLAALCPAHWDVSIVDENVETVPVDPDVDLVGVCGMAVQHPRQRELLAHYRRKGIPVVAGGSYASLCPERFDDVADVVVSGEAEYVWPEFCRDFEHGSTRDLYRETGVVDLADSPVPRFDLLKLGRYTTVSLQFSRGCPFRCEFCDIIVMFGRKPRTKSPEQIGRELDRLRVLGIRSVFFVDDNLIGHRPRAKALLRFLAEYQRRHRYKFQFGTEVSLNLAGDNELLELFRDAHFGWVFVGIESPDEASLLEAGKSQNARVDILASVRRIYRNGIDVLGGFIVGFDADDLDTFRRQERFITAAGVQVAMVGLLTALPKTPLWSRLARAGRLDPGADHADNTRAGLNFEPLRMGREEAVAAYAALYRRLASDRGIATRIRAKARFLRRPVHRPPYSIPERLRILVRLLLRGIAPGGPGRWLRFVGTLVTLRPSCWSTAINDWIVGLSMREFVDGHLDVVRPGAHRAAMGAVEFIRARFGDSLRQGTLAIAQVRTATGERLELALRGRVDAAFFTRAARCLENALRRPTVSLSLRIESLAADQRTALERLLARLARHGDRIQIGVAESVWPLPAIDTSVFHVVFDPA